MNESWLVSPVIVYACVWWMYVYVLEYFYECECACVLSFVDHVWSGLVVNRSVSRKYYWIWMKKIYLIYLGTLRKSEQVVRVTTNWFRRIEISADFMTPVYKCSYTRTYTWRRIQSACRRGFWQLFSIKQSFQLNVLGLSIKDKLYESITTENH